MEEPRNLFEHSGAFREAVQRSDGKVVLLVHPLYDKRGLSGRYKKLLKKLAVAKAPILVMQEEGKIQLAHASLHSHNPFYIETEVGDPEPTQGWEKLHAALRQAGATTILIGGMYANQRVYNEDRPRVEEYERAQFPHLISDPISGGCVGGTYAQIIRAGFGKVRLMPNLIYPRKACHLPRNWPILLAPRSAQLKRQGKRAKQARL